MNALTIAKSGIEDIPQIMNLVNKAYRGEEARQGWTNEAEIIQGSLRTDESSLKQLLSHPDVAILKCSDAKGKIVGCVYLEKKNKDLYLGMLSVWPTMQNLGIGKRLLDAAEKYAQQQNCTAIEMTVISIRKELIAWYKRHGYSDTGQTVPFPEDDRFGTPVKEIEFIVMKKQV